jgi:long-chain acyl-CoA synthetase
MVEKASQVARELERRNVQKGDRIIIWGADCAEWVAAFYGCVLRGAVAVPLDKVSASEFARRIVQQTGTRLAFGSIEQLSNLSGVNGVSVIPFEGFANSIEAHPSGPYSPPSLNRSDPLEILFTSGATAEPKGVVITHGNVLSNIEPLEKGIAKYLHYEKFVHPIRFLSLLPLSHVFGQFMGLFVPGLIRGAVLFPGSFNPSDIARSIRREHVSVLVAVPRMIDALKDQIEREYASRGALERLHAHLESAARLPFARRWMRFRRIHHRLGWKFWAIVSGGAALDSASEEFWRRLGYAVVQGYGMTETTSLVSLNHPFGVERGSIGKALPGREVRVDESGEILVRGESIAAAYWQDGEIKATAAPDGWLHTGDLGAMDASGNLYFKGRKKNVIVTPEGMNVYPQDIENALRADAAVKDCVVLPVPRKGNAIPGAVLLFNDPHPDASAIVMRANASLADYQRVRQWFVWPEPDFPRTSTGKPKLDTILQESLTRFGDASAPEGSHPAAASGSVKGLVARITRRSTNDLPDELSSLSSLERVELMSAMEDHFQVELNESKFTAATTVKDLEDMLRAPSVERTDFFYPYWAQRRPITWIRRIFYNVVTWPVTQILAMPKIIGRNRLKGVKGPVLVISNHLTYFDAGLVLAALPHRLRKLAIAMEGERAQRMRRPPKEWSWIRRLSFRAAYWLMTPLFHVFPLPQRAGFRESFRFAGEAADRGYSVLVFPEGVRTPDGTLQPFRAGIGLLAASLGLTIVPLRIHGLWELKISGRRGYAPWGSIQMHVGDPISFDRGADPREITQALERVMRSL